MPKADDRQIAIDRAVQVLKEAGAVTCSIMASWPDKETKTALVILQQPKPKQALGRGFYEILESEVQGETVKKFLRKK
jgi:hypothetical protein